MAGGPIGGLGPNRVIEFARPPLPFADGVPPAACAFISSALQIADYALVAGLGFFCASAIAPPPASAGTIAATVVAGPQFDPSANQSRVWPSVVTPQGQANAAQYTFGLHAQALYQTEGAKSSVWKSVPTPPAAAAQPAPLRLIFTSQEPIDLSISSWVIEGTQANQGPVPPTIFSSQDNPWQIQPAIWKSAVTPPVLAGRVPPTILASPQADPTQLPAQIWKSLVAPPPPSIIPSVWGTPQADPTQIAPQIWPSIPTLPVITGVTVWPALVVPAQLDTSINPTQLWTPSTFSPALTPPIPPTPDVVPDVIRNFSLRDWRKWHRPEDERELRKLRITPAVAEVIAQVAERQAQALDLDEQQRLEELTRELELKRLKFQGRYLELLNTQRQQLIDEEIARLMQQKQAAIQRMEEEAILLFLMSL